MSKFGILSLLWKNIRLIVYLFKSSDDQKGSQGSSHKSLIEKMKSSGKSIVVLFGSQTGTGEEFAQRLAKNSRLYGLKTLVVDPEEIDIV